MVYRKQRGELAPKQRGSSNAKKRKLTTGQKARGLLQNEARFLNAAGNYAESAGTALTPASAATSGGVSMAGYGARKAGDALKSVGRNNRFAKKTRRVQRDINSTALGAGVGASFAGPIGAGFGALGGLAASELGLMNPDTARRVANPITGSEQGQVDELGTQSVDAASHVLEDGGIPSIEKYTGIKSTANALKNPKAAQALQRGSQALTFGNALYHGDVSGALSTVGREEAANLTRAGMRLL